MIRLLCAWSLLFSLATPSFGQESPDLVDAQLGGADRAEPPILELDLAQALELAMRNNLGLRLAEVDSEVASYDQLGSWGEFEWNFNVQGIYSDSEREVTSSFLSGGATITSQNENLIVDLSKPLTSGGSFGINFNTDRQTTNAAIADAEQLYSDLLAVTLTQPLRRRAWKEYATSIQRERELGWRQQVEIQRQTRQDLVFQVSTAYWDLVAAVEQLKVSISGKALAEELLRRRQRELDAGVGTEVEVLESRADVATRVEAVLQAQNMASERGDELKRILYGNTDESLWSLELVPSTPLPSDPDAQPPTWTDALLTAIELRSELRQLRLAADMARLAHQRTLSERLAGIDLSVTASSGAVDENGSSALSDTANWEFPTWTVGLTYDMPIGNRLADYAERSARSGVRRALLQYDSAEVDVVANVRKAVRDVLFRAQAVRAAQTSLTLSTRQLEAERARNEQGLSTNYQVLEVQQLYVEALSGERSARAEYAKALVALEQSQGLLGEAGNQL